MEVSKLSKKCQVCDGGKKVTWLEDDGSLNKHQPCPRCVEKKW